MIPLPAPQPSVQISELSTTISTESLWNWLNILVKHRLSLPLGENMDEFGTHLCHEMGHSAHNCSYLEIGEDSEVACLIASRRTGENLQVYVSHYATGLGASAELREAFRRQFPNISAAMQSDVIKIALPEPLPHSHTVKKQTSNPDVGRQIFDDRKLSRDQGQVDTRPTRPNQRSGHTQFTTHLPDL